MKNVLLALGLAAGVSTQLAAGETLRLKLEPDRDYVLTGSREEVVVKFDLSAIHERKRLRRTPLNIAVVLDRSGSMSGAKIEKARQAAMVVVDRLTSDDVFSLVAYDDEVKVLVPAQRVTDKEALKEKIQRITPGGSTALYGGVRTGANQIREYISPRRINRVILLSDGLANVGPSSPRELRGLGRELSRHGIAVTTIGVGDDYNEDLMAGLAEASDANYYYVKDTEKLPEIFAKELGELLAVCARDVRIEIICPRGVKPLGFIGRSEAFEDQRAVVTLNQFVPGQDRYLFLRCVVEREVPEIAQVKISYVDELNDGREQTLNGAVRMNYTKDKEVAANSVRGSVVAHKELVVTAVAKDQALTYADAGDYKKAAAQLDVQCAVLEQNLGAAPAPLQAPMQQEIKNLKLRRDELEKGKYDAGSRKAMQSESFMIRNSKSQ